MYNPKLQMGTVSPRVYGKLTQKVNINKLNQWLPQQHNLFQYELKLW